jgi:hypothetical protein
MFFTLYTIIHEYKIKEPVNLLNILVTLRWVDFFRCHERCQKRVKILFFFYLLHICLFTLTLLTMGNMHLLPSIHWLPGRQWLPLHWLPDTGYPKSRHWLTPIFYPFKMALIHKPTDSIIKSALHAYLWKIIKCIKVEADDSHFKSSQCWQLAGIYPGFRGIWSH